MDYRAFLLNPAGRINKVVELQAAGEAEARREIERVHRPEHGYELWSEKTLVARAVPGER